MKNIANQLKDIMINKVGIEKPGLMKKIKLDDNIRDVVDSLDLVESIMAFETHFKIELDDGEMDQVFTLRHLVTHIEAAIAVKEAGD